MATILVVEDERDMCNLIRTQLEAEGHAVYQAFDGKTALQLVEAYTPQLVILDWMLLIRHSTGRRRCNWLKRIRPNW